MIRSTQGIIHGKTIELAEDLGVAEGPRVEVQVKIISTEVGATTSARGCCGGSCERGVRCAEIAKSP